MTDPRFLGEPEGAGGGGAPTPKVRVKKTVIWPIFSRNLHENKISWTERGRVPGASFDPPMECDRRSDIFFDVRSSINVKS